MVPVMPEEDVVSLIMQCDHSSPTELRVMWKHGRKESTYGVTETSVEVV